MPLPRNAGVSSERCDGMPIPPRTTATSAEGLIIPTYVTRNRPYGTLLRTVTYYLFRNSTGKNNLEEYCRNVVLRSRIEIRERVR